MKHNRMKIFSKICLINAILFCSACQTIKGVDNDRQALVKTLNVFRAKTPNYVYDTLGEPDDYQVEVDKNNDVVKGIITYKYLYNFKTKMYDCTIRFLTDKEQDEVVGYEYSSEKCFSIFTK